LQSAAARRKSFRIISILSKSAEPARRLSAARANRQGILGAQWERDAGGAEQNSRPPCIYLRINCAIAATVILKHG
jgi:hypothetical protein